MNPNFDYSGLQVHAEDLKALTLISEIALPRGASRQKPWLFVEVGAGHGRISVALEQRATRLRKKPGRLFACDLWGAPEGFETFLRNMGDKLYRSVFPVRGCPLAVARTWPRFKRALNELDLLCVWPHFCTEELLRAYLPLIRKGGVLCGLGYGFGEHVAAAAGSLGFELNKMGRSVWWKQLS